MKFWVITRSMMGGILEVHSIFGDEECRVFRHGRVDLGCNFWGGQSQNPRLEGDTLWTSS